MKAKGFNEASIAALWGVLVPFSDYAFNKAHTAAYGLVSYWTAYLKANYPAEYMAALLTSVGDDKDKSALYLGECRRMGIKVLPPDVNDSIGQFAAVGTDIRFGLQAIRNVGAQRRRGDHRGPRGEGALHLVPGLPVEGAGGGVQQAHHRVAHQGRGVRRARRRPAMGLLACTRSTSTRSSTIKRQEAIGQDSPVRGVRRRRRRRLRRRPDAPTPSRASSGTSRRCCRSSARCSASTSPTTRCSASSTCSPRTPTPPSPPDGDDAQAGGLEGHHRRPDHRPAGQAHQEGRPLGDRDASRTSRAPSSACSSPAPTSPWHACCTRTPSPWSRGRVNRRDDTPTIYAAGADPARRQRGPARAGGGHHGADPAHPAGVEELKTVLRQPPGHHRGAPAAGQARHGRSRCGSTPAYRVNATEALFGDLKVLLGPRCLV